MKNPRDIFITDYDLQRLKEVIWEAQQSGYRGSAYIKNLMTELDRAHIVMPVDIPGDVVTMNSRVSVTDVDTGEDMIFTLVFPKDSNIREDKISILAPLGTAVLGYRVGDTFEWEVPDGVKRFKIEKILYQPEDAGDYLL